MTEVVLHSIRALAVGSGAAPFKRLKRPFGRTVHLIGVDCSGSMLLRKLGREMAGALPKHQEIGKRISAEPVGAVQSGSRFSCRK